MWVWLSACTPGPTRLWIGGDVHLAAPRALLSPELARALPAAGIVNLEGPIGAPRTAVAEDGTVTLVHGVEVLGALQAAGVVGVGVENNHARDAGPDGPARTRDAARAAGLAATPGRVDGLDWVQVDLADGPPTDLAARLAGADIVTFHVTGPPSPLPAPDLRAAVDAAVAAGARVVAAHGTHAWGPVERRGDAVIAWGLGNLAFDCPCTRARDGLVLDVTLPRGPGVVRARIVPIDAGIDGAPAALAEEGEERLDSLAALSTVPLARGADGAEF